MISIIIPAFNEEASIADLLQSIRKRRNEAACEVIVGDGGSEDRTVSIARDYGRVVECERGRAKQMNTAAQSAQGEILFFLHADSHLPPGALKEIENKIQREGYDGGGFSNVFSSHNKTIKTLGRILNLRLRDNDRPDNTIFFGDNGIFVRKSVFEAMGGFPDIPIMEDYEFSSRLRKSYRSVRIMFPKLVVSPRRHLKSGMLKTRLQWIVIRRLYKFGVSPTTLAKLYSDVR